MKIPILEAPTVNAAGYNTGSSALIQPENVEKAFNVAAQGVEKFGAGLELQQRHERELERKAKERADELAAANALAELQTHATKRLDGDSQEHIVSVDLTAPAPGPDSPESGISRRVGSPGFLSTQGEEAIRMSAPVWDDLEKARKEIRNKLPNPEQQRTFDLHSNGLMEGFYRRLEDHVATQTEVAQKATVKRMEESALVAARNDYQNVDTAKEASGPVEALLDSRALSDADRVGARAEWRSKVDVERLGAAMDAKNWGFAQKLFAEVKDQLGPTVDRGKLQRAIEEGVGSQIAHSEARKFLADTVTAERPWGDAAKAREAAAKRPVDEHTEKIDALLHRFLIEKAEEKKAFVETTFDSALSTLEKNNYDITKVDAREKQILQDKLNDPLAWRKLENIADEALRERKARLAGAKEHETEDQRQALLELKADIVDHPDKYADMTPGEFKLQWRSRLSAAGYTHGGDAYVAAQKADRVKAGEFSKWVSDEIGRQPSMPKANARRMKAFLGEQRRRYLDTFHKEPDDDARKKMREAAWRDVTTPGAVFGDLWPNHDPMYLHEPDPGEGADGEPAAPAPRTIKSWKVSPDRKQRAPVYDDGSVGPVEAAP